MTRNLIINAFLIVIMAGFVLACGDKSDKMSTPQVGSISGIAQTGQTGGIGQIVSTIPPVKGYTEGQEIRFIHTEASDLTVAQMLTGMMGSPVLVVSSLAQAPESMLANVYVFTNGVKGEGPLGFQADVFDNPPPAAGYRPLRALIRVTWKDEKSAQILKSAAEVKDAETKGKVKLDRSGVVINMPMLTWPGGQR